MVTFLCEDYGHIRLWIDGAFLPWALKCFQFSKQIAFKLNSFQLRQLFCSETFPFFPNAHRLSYNYYANYFFQFQNKSILCSNT